jgi:hypothetical protein
VSGTTSLILASSLSEERQMMIAMVPRT